MARIAPLHVRFEGHVVGGTAERELDGIPEPLPGGITPDAPQVR
jgi:hypothetical protein